MAKKLVNYDLNDEINDSDNENDDGDDGDDGVKLSENEDEKNGKNKRRRVAWAYKECFESKAAAENELKTNKWIKWKEHITKGG